jgi:undecaprenyl-phosphate 4-deoxy-4-formamido-L-arabinose transferase
MRTLSFVIPCYGSEKTIEKVVDEIRKTVGKRKGNAYEIILVNDRSPDGVLEVIKKICGGDKKVKGISLSKNFGQQSALMAGQAAATGDAVICLDDDGQSPVNNVYEMIDMLDGGYDVVFAKYGIKKQSVMKNFGSWLNLVMLGLMLNKPKNIEFSSYFVMRRLISDEMIKYKNPYPYNMGLILSITRNIGNFKCEDRSRLSGKTGYTFAKLVGLWVNGLTNFSIMPLRMATFLGVITGTFGFAFGVYTVINKILNPDVPVGYSAIVSMFSFIGGIILLVLGIIGEYIGRIYISINRIPQYVVDKRINFK